MTDSIIYKFTSYGEEKIGYVTSDGQICSLLRQKGTVIGRYDPSGRIFRATSHDERELGSVSQEGVIHSHGLFEGGELGWIEEDGVVMRGGLIFDEDDVGRVEGPKVREAAAALLLIFLPEEAEENRRMMR
jgi:hypothetical protein